MLTNALQDEGVVEWTLPIAGVESVIGCPAIGPDGTIYVLANGPFSPPPFKGRVYAISPDGAVKPGWPVEIGPMAETVPTLSPDGTLYMGSLDGKLYAVTGETTVTDSARDRRSITLSSFSIQSPASLSADGKTVYVGTDDGAFCAVTANVSRSVQLLERWRFRIGAQVLAGSAIGSDGTIYVGALDAKVYALSPEGVLRPGWPVTIEAPSTTTAAIAEDGTIYVSAIDGKLYALNPDGTAKPGWPFATGGGLGASAVISEDGTVFIASSDGKLYALSPDGVLKPGWPFRPGGPFDIALITPAIGRNGAIYLDAGDPFGTGRVTGINPNGTLRPNWPVFHAKISGTRGITIAPDGRILLTTKNMDVMAIRTGSLGLAQTGWPKFHRDLGNTGQR